MRSIICVQSQVKHYLFLTPLQSFVEISASEILFQREYFSNIILRSGFTLDIRIAL